MLKVSLLLAVLVLTACESQASGGILPPFVHPGQLQGHVSIGPLTPVERVGVPAPTVPPEVYAARQIIIYKEDGKTEVTRPRIDASGHYSVTLAAGAYVVGMARSGIDRANGLPAQVTIESGQTTTLDIAIDTGIR